MRVVKQRLLEMMPDSSVFLDVDDLQEGRGAEYVDKSMVILVCCTRGYFDSVNCMRELLRALYNGKPLIALLEPEARRGGMTRDEVSKALREVHDEGSYAKWGLDAELQQWGMQPPTHLYNIIFADTPIEWNRIGAFQVCLPCPCLPAARYMGAIFYDRVIHYL